MHIDNSTQSKEQKFDEESSVMRNFIERSFLWTGCSDQNIHSQVHYLKLVQKFCENNTLSLEQAPLKRQSLIDQIKYKIVEKIKNKKLKFNNKYSVFQKPVQESRIGIGNYNLKALSNKYLHLKIDKAYFSKKNQQHWCNREQSFYVQCFRANIQNQYEFFDKIKFIMQKTLWFKELYVYLRQ